MMLKFTVIWWHVSPGVVQMIWTGPFPCSEQFLLCFKEIMECPRLSFFKRPKCSHFSSRYSIKNCWTSGEICNSLARRACHKAGLMQDGLFHGVFEWDSVSAQERAVSQGQRDGVCPTTACCEQRQAASQCLESACPTAKEGNRQENDMMI